MAVGLFIVGLQLASPATQVSGLPLGTPTPKTMGNSPSNPDGGGVDKPYSADGQPAGSQGPAYFDGNNGCGQDRRYDAAPDAQGGYDDNNGHCGNRNLFQVGTATATPFGTVVAGAHVAVEVCHREGNGSSHTITVDDNAVAAHLAHGDILGACVIVAVGTPSVTATSSGLEVATSTPTTVANTATATTEAGTSTPTATTEAGTSTPTATTEAGTNTPTATTEAGTSTPTATTEAGTNTPTATTEVATSTPTTVPATSTSGPLTVVTNTPTNQTIVSSESLGGIQGGANAVGGGIQGGANGGASVEQFALSGTQGGANGVGSGFGAQQGVASGVQGGANGGVSGAAQLPSTGSGGADSGTNGMLYFGMALMILGAGLGGTRMLTRR